MDAPAHRIMRDLATTPAGVTTLHRAAFANGTSTIGILLRRAFELRDET